MDKQLNAVILARVSSKSQEDEGYSLDSQMKLLQGYCENRGLNVVKAFKIAETASKEQSRKVFQELLSYIYTNKICHLTVEKTDRFTRNFRDAVAIDDWLEKDDSRRLHAVKENILLHKNAKSDVKFMWNIHVAVAKKYADNLREEAMKGWAEKLAQGWLPAPPPPGYMTIIQNGKRIHVPDPETWQIIVRIFKLYLQLNHSINSITEQMRILGIRTRKGRPYAKSQVQKILNNPFYIGINRFDGTDYPGAQEPIISKDLFYKVQEKMHKGRPAVQRTHNPVFKNLIICERCRGAVTWSLQKGRYYGSCQRRTAECKARSAIREDRVEEQVVKLLEQLVCPSPEIIDWVATSMREEQQTGIENRERLVSSIRTNLSRVERMDNQLYDDKLSGDISKEKYELKHEQFASEQAELQAQLDKIDVSATRGLEQRLVILELTQKAATIYRSRTPDQKRLLMIRLFASMTTTDEGVSVKFTNFAQAIAERALKTTNLLGGKI